MKDFDEKKENERVLGFFMCVLIYKIYYMNFWLPLLFLLLKCVVSFLMVTYNIHINKFHPFLSILVGKKCIEKVHAVIIVIIVSCTRINYRLIC